MPAFAIEVSRSILGGQPKTHSSGASDDLAAKGRTFKNVHGAKSSGSTYELDPVYGLFAHLMCVFLFVSPAVQLSEVALEQATP